MGELDQALGLRTESEYGAAGPRPAWSPSVPSVLTAVGALLVGFLVASGYVAGRTAAGEQGARKAELIALIHARQERADALAAQLEQLRAEVTAAQTAVSAAGAPSLNARLAETEASTGFTALAGPGLRVTFADAAAPCPTGRPEDCRIQDVDLQLAVNALWALGAEGVAVNGERIIATTAIRSAGSAVLVNYRVLTSPYVVEAVGDAEAMHRGFDDSDVAADFAVWRDAYSLGFSVNEADDVLLPPYSGAVTLDAAAVVDPAGENL